MPEYTEKLPEAETPVQILAQYLHSRYCTWNHADGCFWFYENSWDEYTHAKWINEAFDLKFQWSRFEG